MIDEQELETLFAELAECIPVPEAAWEGFGHGVGDEPRSRFRRPSGRNVLLVAAVILVIVAGAVVLAGRKLGNQQTPTTAIAEQGTRTPRSTAAGGTISAGLPSLRFGPLHGANGASSAGTTAPAPAAPRDQAKIVKTGSIDLQAARGTLRATTNRVTALVVGLGGYVSDSKTSYGDTDPTAQITLRVPVGSFDTAITRLTKLTGVKVLGQTENGDDVTGQYVDLQAQLTAATTERDALETVLAAARTVGDILAVRDHLSNAQSRVDQLQGQINLLDNQASLSSIAVSLAEKPRPARHVESVRPPTGLEKAWRDARRGFANSVEWFIARSGGALVILVIGLVLVFALRRLYPVVRRALL